LENEIINFNTPDPLNINEELLIINFNFHSKFVNEFNILYPKLKDYVDELNLKQNSELSIIDVSNSREQDQNITKPIFNPICLLENENDKTSSILVFSRVYKTLYGKQICQYPLCIFDFAADLSNEKIIKGRNVRFENLKNHATFCSILNEILNRLLKDNNSNNYFKELQDNIVLLTSKTDIRNFL
jgi:hypothetical protein